MDLQVEKALAKWPNVPHCYGWLALDAQGSWRMRDEQAQKNGNLGERITQQALAGFIQRNYTHDEQGRWYFQNGPQRVYVELEAAPYIARIEPGSMLVLHTGDPMPDFDRACLSDRGNLWLCRGEYTAMLDGRDLAHCLPLLTIDGKPVDDVSLQAWMDSAGDCGRLALSWHDSSKAVEYLPEAEAPQRFGFVRSPQASIAVQNP
jgi:hypothetical protein